MHHVVTSLHNETGTNTGTPAGRNKCHTRKSGSNSKGNERRNENQQSQDECLTRRNDGLAKRDDGLPGSDVGLYKRGEGQLREDEEMEVAVDAFEEMLNKMDPDLGVNREKSESKSEHQEVPE